MKLNLSKNTETTITNTLERVSKKQLENSHIYPDLISGMTKIKIGIVTKPKEFDLNQELLYNKLISSNEYDFKQKFNNYLIQISDAINKQLTNFDLSSNWLDFEIVIGNNTFTYLSIPTTELLAGSNKEKFDDYLADLKAKRKALLEKLNQNACDFCKLMPAPLTSNILLNKSELLDYDITLQQYVLTVPHEGDDEDTLFPTFCPNCGKKLLTNEK